MPVPDCHYGKCVVGNLHDEKVELEKDIEDLRQALEAGAVKPENQSASNAEQDTKLMDVDRLKLEISVNISKLCDICPFRLPDQPDKKSDKSTE